MAGAHGGGSGWGSYSQFRILKYTVHGALADKGWSLVGCGHSFLARVTYFRMVLRAVGRAGGDCNGGGGGRG
jgi:hypothetical protein